MGFLWLLVGVWVWRLVVLMNLRFRYYKLFRFGFVCFLVAIVLRWWVGLSLVVFLFVWFDWCFVVLLVFLGFVVIVCFCF